MYTRVAKPGVAPTHHLSYGYVRPLGQERPRGQGVSGNRTMREIVEEIKTDWVRWKNGEAFQLLRWMLTLDSSEDVERVRKFLSCASSWRGERAKYIKKELRRLLERKADELSRLPPPG